MTGVKLRIGSILTILHLVFNFQYDTSYIIIRNEEHADFYR